MSLGFRDISNFNINLPYQQQLMNDALIVVIAEYQAVYND